jgi:hypothetical protein
MVGKKYKKNKTIKNLFSKIAQFYETSMHALYNHKITVINTIFPSFYDWLHIL